MKRKIIIAALGIALLLGAYFLQPLIFPKPERPANFGKKKADQNIPTAFVKSVHNADLPIVLTATGNLVAKERVELFAEVQGILQRSSKPFKAGTRYGRGEVLLRVRGDENYANLQAMKSTLYNQITASLADLKIDYPDAFSAWKQYADNFDLSKPVAELPTPTSSREKMFISARSIFNTYYSVKNLEIRQGKYVIRAPFSGVLTEADITPGTLVRVGQRLGEFISTGAYEMEVSVNASFAPYLKVGKKVQVSNINNPTQTLEGEVVRVNGKVDRASQTITAYIQLQGKDLAEGMYLEAKLRAKDAEQVVEIPRNLLVDKTQLYVAQDSLLKLMEIQPVHFSEKSVLVKGLSNGDKVLMSPLPGAFDGMKVKLFEEEAEETKADTVAKSIAEH